MNKRQLKKREHQQEIEHEHELAKTSWGRIQLSYERLESAFDDFVATLIEEAVGARKSWSEQLFAQLRALDHDVSPTVARVPVVGRVVARGIHQVAAAAS